MYIYVELSHNHLSLSVLLHYNTHDEITMKLSITRREIAVIDMKHLGLETTFLECPIDVTDRAHWEGIRTRYWFDKVYHLPLCRKPAAAAL